jgi:hypothetical protein
VTAGATDGGVTGRVTLTPDDGAMLLRAARTRRRFFNQGRLLMYCAGAAWLAAILAADGPHRATVVLIFASAAFGIAALLSIVRAQRAFVVRHGGGQVRDITVDDDGVTIADPGMTVRYAWMRFDRAFEASDHFVLHSASDTVSLPKRAFAADDVARVRATIAERLRIEPLS